MHLKRVVCYRERLSLIKKILIDGCKVLKDKLFYKEVFDELYTFKNSDNFNSLSKDYQQSTIRLFVECTYQDKERYQYHLRDCK